jgi:hypothetical protein
MYVMYAYEYGTSVAHFIFLLYSCFLSRGRAGKIRACRVRVTCLSFYSQSRVLRIASCHQVKSCNTRVLRRQGRLNFLSILFTPTYPPTQPPTHPHTVAGVSIMVAFIRGSADALKYNAGAGGTHATMTGVNNRHSGAETGYAINGCFFGLGGSNYVSSGTNFVQAVPRIGTYLTVSSNGAGLSSFMGAGTSTNSYTGQLSVQMIRFNAGVATDLFLGAGW